MYKNSHLFKVSILVRTPGDKGILKGAKGYIPPFPPPFSMFVTWLKVFTVISCSS